MFVNLKWHKLHVLTFKTAIIKCAICVSFSVEPKCEKTPNNLTESSDIRCSAELSEADMKLHTNFSYACTLLANTTTQTRRFEMPHCNDTYSGK